MHGELTDGLALQERALAILVPIAGPDNPGLLVPRLGAGAILTELLRSAEAEAQLRAALHAAESDGPENVRVARALDALGRALSDLGKYEEAQAAHARALAIMEKQLRPGHPDLLYALVGLGRAYVGARRPERAVPHLERALRLDATGKTLERAEAELLLAQALRALRRSPRRARDFILHARDTYRTAGAGPRHDRVLSRIEALAAKG
jgi:serine/threonine-protein kinase